MKARNPQGACKPKLRDSEKYHQDSSYKTLKYYVSFEFNVLCDCSN